MFAWNWNAIVCLVVGIGVGTLAWLGLSRALGEQDYVKGIAFILSGLSMVVLDIISRWRDRGYTGKWRLISPSAGGVVAVVPVWFVGLIAVLGGLQLALSD